MLARGNTEVVVTLPSDREICFTRWFDHSRQQLFEAWTRPEHVPRWWGCDGSRVVACEIDLRVGGSWKIVTRMLDGSEHPFRGVYREIVPGERLVYTECYDAPQFGSPEWLTTVTFIDAQGGTRLTHNILHKSREARDGHLQAGMEAGSVQMLHHLDEHVAQMNRTAVRE
jgi:uncharacterized protein YndB with AHSA1/START domain